MIDRRNTDTVRMRHPSGQSRIEDNTYGGDQIIRQFHQTNPITPKLNFSPSYFTALLMSAQPWLSSKIASARKYALSPYVLGWTTKVLLENES